MSMSTSALPALARALRNDRAIAFIGAGASVSLGVGYPTWDGLLKELHQEVLGMLPPGDDSPKGSRRWVRAGPRAVAGLELVSDPLWRAEEYRRLIEQARPKHYRKLLKQLFDRKWAGTAVPPGNGLLSAVAGLPFRYVFNTNFDPSLEDTYQTLGARLTCLDWSERDRLQRMLVRLWDDPAEGVTLVYLHGSVQDPARIVLTERDYVDRYVSNDDTGRKLFALFISRCFVFIGFSLNDPELAYVLRGMRAHTGRHEPRHFAFIASDADPDQQAIEASTYRGKYGVEPIFYHPRDGHAELVAILHALRGQVESTGTGGGPPPPPSGGRGSADAGEGPPPRLDKSVVSHHAAADPEDPNKHRFGGSPRSNGLELSARVTQDADDRDWFRIDLQVVPYEARDFTGRVSFHLHPTFPRAKVRVQVRNARAELVRWAYGAFTVGAVADDGTQLELDLAELPDAPHLFRIR